MQTFREWLREKENKKIDEELCIFESFDSHYNITRAYQNKEFFFYDFKIRSTTYRVFIESMLNYEMIHIGFEKLSEDGSWRIKGIDNELENGEIQKLFGTLIYVVKELYKGIYSNILFSTNEEKKFRTYLRLASQISNKLLPNSSVSHNERRIIIHKNVKEQFNLNSLITKYIPKK